MIWQAMARGWLKSTRKKCVCGRGKIEASSKKKQALWAGRVSGSCQDRVFILRAWEQY